MDPLVPCVLLPALLLYGVHRWQMVHGRPERARPPGAGLPRLYFLGGLLAGILLGVAVGRLFFRFPGEYGGGPPILSPGGWGTVRMDHSPGFQSEMRAGALIGGFMGAVVGWARGTDVARRLRRKADPGSGSGSPEA